MLKEQRRGEQNGLTESKEEAKEKQEREDPKLQGKQFQRRNTRNVIFMKSEEETEECVKNRIMNK